MAICPTCNQPIKESIAAGRKLLNLVQAGPYAGCGRYLIVLNLSCACGVRTERRYENRKLATVGR
jgi:hypothetical protein